MGGAVAEATGHVHRQGERTPRRSVRVLGAWAVMSLALAAAWVAPGRASAQAAAPAASVPGPSPAPARYVPLDELDRLEYLGRSKPQLAIDGLLRYAATLTPEDPRLLEALMDIGSRYVTLSMGDQVEATAHRIENLGASVPLARPAAMLLRGQWLDVHDEPSRAERQLIEASALLPPTIPDFLRIRLLVSYGDVKSRGGHYDEAMVRFNEAMRLVDEKGPVWRRIDVRGLIESVLREAGQLDKAAEITAEQMRLATEAGDDVGMGVASTARAIQLSDGPDGAATLAAWNEAIEHARLSGDTAALALGLANIADYYLTHGDYQTAYDMSMRALPMARQVKDEAAQSVALANIGLALISMKRKDEGMPYMREARALDEQAGSAREIADSSRELGGYLEKAGYLADALAAYRQYRQLATELNQQDRQRALIELQEGFANERRQHELDMLSREGRLKDEQILHHDLELQQWAAVGVSCLLLVAVVASLARRLRVRNQQLTASNEQLRIQAEIDPLTGLSNRHHLQAVLAGRPSRVLEGTLFLIDIDHFKRINDRHGHAGGDAVLIEIARRLRATLRDDDLIVRWGGEEFLVLVRPMPTAESEALAQRLLSALADAPVTHEGRQIPVSASIGYGVFPLRDGTIEHAVDWECAIRFVDNAMYLAKAHGRNGACGIRTVRVDDTPALAEVAHGLEAAWSEGRAQLHLQQGPAVQGVPA
jgi:diguanylate cyclase (GGDEF)-like protein